MSRLDARRFQHPLLYGVAFYVAFIGIGTLVSLLLGNGIPWIGWVVCAAIWAAIVALMCRRARTYRAYLGP